MDRAAALFRLAPTEAKLERKHRDAGEALANSREDARRQQRDIQDLERVQDLEHRNARHRAAHSKARLREEEQQQEENAASFRDVTTAARRELADITSNNLARRNLY